MGVNRSKNSKVTQVINEQLGGCEFVAASNCNILNQKENKKR